ncbi:MAG: NPCBM/NEW2 domain-containing protein, partial [Planctomycetia bacterium]|nr:NPCBM/NEW2 domain-containing protein [Planctomycetia bacterium]
MFDPYRKWLGISEANRPPTHYQLLAIEPEETDPDVIRAAVTQRSAYVRNFQSGKHADDATRLLNEIAAAEACVSNKEKRAAYDAELKRKQPRPKPAPRPVPPVAAAPPIDPLWAHAASVASAPPPAWMQQPRRKSLAAWQWAAIAGGGVVALLILGLIVAGMRNAKLQASSHDVEIDSEATAHPTPAVQQSTPLQAAETGNLVDDAVAEAANDPRPNALNFPSSTDESEIAPLELPGPLGLVADRVVLWNTHNAEHNDRGTHECEIRLVLGGETVWHSQPIVVPWTRDRDQSVSVPLPKVRFDHLRVDVSKGADAIGAGLSEIQVFQGNANVARGCPARSNRFLDHRFSADEVTDGVTSSRSMGHGYWLLADGNPGWAEVDLSLPLPSDQLGVVSERIVLWNEHNGSSNNSGTVRCQVVLLHNDSEVWRNANVVVPWEANRDMFVAISPPPVAFDRVRVEIEERTGNSGGLAEIEVISQGENLAFLCSAIASSYPDESRRADRVTDGITSSKTELQGYWILNDGIDGWIEVDLASRDPQMSFARRQLGEYLCYVANDWSKGLPWLARCGNEELVTLSRTELSDPSDAATLVALADAWWELAAERHPTARQGLRARAAYRYRGAISRLTPINRPRAEQRIAEVLPHLPDRHFLYYLQESDVSGMWPPFDLREGHTRIAGERATHGLFMHPGPGGTASAVFHLANKVRRFLGGAAIDDSALGQTATALTFRVLGDGRPLWTSAPVQRSGIRQDFDLDVQGVDKLELLVDCPGPNHAAGGVWWQPRLEE